MHSLDMHNVYMSSKYDGFKMIIRNGIKKKLNKISRISFWMENKRKNEREMVCMCVEFINS